MNRIFLVIIYLLCAICLNAQLIWEHDTALTARENGKTSAVVVNDKIISVCMGIDSVGYSLQAKCTDVAGTALWNNNSLVISTDLNGINSDLGCIKASDNGVIIYWISNANVLKAQKISTEGSILWANDIIISSSSGAKQQFLLTSDLSGGAYVAFIEQNNTVKYGHLESSGVLSYDLMSLPLTGVTAWGNYLNILALSTSTFKFFVSIGSDIMHIYTIEANGSVGTSLTKPGTSVVFYDNQDYLCFNSAGMHKYNANNELSWEILLPQGNYISRILLIPETQNLILTTYYEHTDYGGTEPTTTYHYFCKKYDSQGVYISGLEIGTASYNGNMVSEALSLYGPYFMNDKICYFIHKVTQYYGGGGYESFNYYALNSDMQLITSRSLSLDPEYLMFLPIANGFAILKKQENTLSIGIYNIIILNYSATITLFPSYTFTMLNSKNYDLGSKMVVVTGETNNWKVNRLNTEGELGLWINFQNCGGNDIYSFFAKTLDNRLYHLCNTQGDGSFATAYDPENGNSEMFTMSSCIDISRYFNTEGAVLSVDTAGHVRAMNNFIFNQNYQLSLPVAYEYVTNSGNNFLFKSGSNLFYYKINDDATCPDYIPFGGLQVTGNVSDSFVQGVLSNAGYLVTWRRGETEINAVLINPENGMFIELNNGFSLLNTTGLINSYRLLEINDEIYLLWNETQNGQLKLKGQCYSWQNSDFVPNWGSNGIIIDDNVSIFEARVINDRIILSSVKGNTVFVRILSAGGSTILNQQVSISNGNILELGIYPTIENLAFLYWKTCLNSNSMSSAFHYQLVFTDPVDTDDSVNNVQPDLYLFNNYPNPFNPSTTIRYNIPVNSLVTLDVYNVRGQLVKTLVDVKQGKGEHSVVWNGKDSNNKQVGSGVYFYKLADGNRTIRKKMILIK